MRDLVKKYVLKNAIDHGGSANPGAVLGRVLGEDPHLKPKIAELKTLIAEVIKEVSSLSAKEQIDQLTSLAPELLSAQKPKEKKKEPELPGAKKGKVVMRFAPSPSGPLHIGHAYVLALNAFLCKKYDGKLILRLDDTNPENIFPDAYDLIYEDAQWLTSNKIHKTFVQSDLMDSYYATVEQLIEKEACYVCTCSGDEFREYSKKKHACPCREITKEENRKRWAKMLAKEGYVEGEAVVRIKTSMDHKDPAMRDWPALRIKLALHPRHGDKYRVWPLLAFAIGVNDHEMGVTHAIRGKDQMGSDRRIMFLYDHLGWKQPEHIYVGFINFTDLRLSKTETRAKIDAGEYAGWDDVRLPFLRAMKRRGYQPEAFIKYALDVGITQNDKKVSKKEFFKTVNHFNKEIIDDKTNRYFFVADPQEITLEGAPPQTVELKLHPDHPERGMRSFATSDHFYITAEDKQKLTEGKLHRLMDCLNFTVTKGTYRFDSLEYEKYKQAGGMIIHWLPQETVDVRVLMDDGSVATGRGESTLTTLKPGDLVQFERFGFCRLENDLTFIFTHR